MPTPKPKWSVRFLLRQDEFSEPLWSSSCVVSARGYSGALHAASEELNINESKVIAVEAKKEGES